MTSEVRVVGVDRKQGFLLVLVAASMVLVGLMLRPFFGYVSLGALLAFSLHPVYRRVPDRIPDSVGALGVVFVTLVAAIAPVLFLGSQLVIDARSVAEDAQDVELSSVEQRLQDVAGRPVDLESRVSGLAETAGSWLVGSFSGILSLASGVAIGLTLMVFTQFYLLRDGERLVDWTESFDLLPGDGQERVYSDLARMTRSVLKGHILVAVAQGILAGIGLALAGVPSPVFWTVAMVLLGFVPMVGSLAVWLPASVWLAATGDLVAGAALAAWGFVIVGAADNLLRPLFIDDEADLHPFLVILGVIGGTSVFGLIGILLGPIALGLAKTLSTVYLESQE